MLAGLGTGIIGLAGPAPLRGRIVRIGLCALALGLASIAVSSVISMTLTSDALEDRPSVILLLAGVLLVTIGTPVTFLSVLFVPGPPRRIGGLFLGGLVLDIVGGNILLSLSMNGAVHDQAQPLLVVAAGATLAGTGAIIFAIAGIGWLVIDGSRAVAAAPA